MATHSSILAWRLPWTEEPGRLYSMGSQSIGHDSDGKESACNVGDPGSIPGLGRLLEEGMATHSSILAWRLPCTEEPGGLQSMGSKSQTHVHQPREIKGNHK